MGAPNLAYRSAMHGSSTLRWFRPPPRGLKKDLRKRVQGKLLFCYISETKHGILIVPMYFLSTFLALHFALEVGEMAEKTVPIFMQYSLR